MASDSTSINELPPMPDAFPDEAVTSWNLLVQRPKIVTVDASGDRLQITLKKNPAAMWQLAAGCFAMGCVGLIAAYLLDRYQNANAESLTIHFGVTKLYIVSTACVGIALLLGLILITTGGERDTVLSVAFGHMTIDRWVAGDHMVRTYHWDDLNSIWTDEAINVGARVGTFSVGTSLPSSIQDAVVDVVGHSFWGDEVAVARKLKRRIGIGSTLIRIAAARQHNDVE